VYPRENEGLSRRILEQGCLVSEYPPGIPARPDYFPRRNRILSGLARATLVVEAGEGSGALHTANWAFGQGRDVFAVSGSVFSRQSIGTNQLIRESTAKLVATPEQLCEELNVLAVSGQPRLLETPRSPSAPPAAVVFEAPAAVRTPDEALVLEALTKPSHVDEVARSIGRPVASVSGTLQILELMGRVKQTAPMTYEKA
jgi:DNA processing protein